MFFYIVLIHYIPFPVYEVPAIRVNTTKSTYTFTSVLMRCFIVIFFLVSSDCLCSVAPKFLTMPGFDLQYVNVVLPIGQTQIAILDSSKSI